MNRFITIAIASVFSIGAIAAGFHVEKEVDGVEYILTSNGDLAVDGDFIGNFYDVSYLKAYQEWEFKYNQLKNAKKGVEDQLKSTKKKLQAQLNAKAKLAEKHDLKKKNPHYADIEDAIQATTIEAAVDALNLMEQDNDIPSFIGTDEYNEIVDLYSVTNDLDAALDSAYSTGVKDAEALDIAEAVDAVESADLD